jgi:hypothetical protein
MLYACGYAKKFKFYIFYIADNGTLAVAGIIGDDI